MSFLKEKMKEKQDVKRTWRKVFDICHSTSLDPMLPNAQAIAAREMGRHCLFFNHLHIITQTFLLRQLHRRRMG